MVNVVFWGTYDTGKPRVRLLLAGARSQGMNVRECHVPVWQGIDDKHFVLGNWKLVLRHLCRILLASPVLVWKYLRMPAHDVVVIPYWGEWDALVLWLWAFLRRVPVVLDAFIPVHEAVVSDRGYLSSSSFLSRCLYGFEWLAFRAAAGVLADTPAHARYLESFFRLNPRRIKVVQVGVEADVFSRQFLLEEKRVRPTEVHVLFYGQLMPLQGVETVMRAVGIVEKKGQTVRWTVIGSGQEEAKVSSLIREMNPKRMEWIRWVPYEELPGFIAKADICLGVFGKTEKCQCVIPNKIFQAISMRKPVITADTPAMREWLSPKPWLKLIPPADTESLAQAVIAMSCLLPFEELFSPSDLCVGPREVGLQLRKAVDELIATQ